MKNLLLACSLLCAPIASFASSDLGNQTYKELWKVLDSKEYDEVIKLSRSCIKSKSYTNEDRVHFYVIILHAYMAKEDIKSWNEVHIELQELINNDESAFWEFRSYYDC